VSDVDFQKNLISITYDPNQLTPEAMLETIRKEGFQGKIVPD
jgi:hypothetical protein